jgi:chromosome segregation ATPase
MKSKLILSALVAGTMLLNSCSTGVSEETKTSMATFEAAWAEAGTMATNWGADLTAQYTKTKEHVDKQTAMMTETMPKMKDEATKTKLMEMDNNDKANLTALENMKNEFTTFETEWQKNTADYTAWKEKVDKGEVNNTEATATLTEWNTKLDNAKNQLNTWNTAYATTKAKSEEDMAACDAMMTAATTPAPKK